MTMDTATKLTDIRTLSLEELTSQLILTGEKKFRAKQVYQWLWEKGARSFDDMTNLSLDLREKLKGRYELLTITEDKVQRSNDGTIKSRFRLHDGHLIESVLIPVVAENLRPGFPRQRTVHGNLRQATDEHRLHGYGRAIASL